MKTSVIEVHDMLSVLSVLGVEKRIGEVPGVESVTVNYAAGSATVRYDETRLDIADIRSAVRQSGYEVADAPAAASKGDSHEGHTAPSEPPATPAPAAAKTPRSHLPPRAPLPQARHNKTKRGRARRRQQRRKLPRPRRPPHARPRPQQRNQSRTPLLQATNNTTKRRPAKVRTTRVLRSCHNEDSATFKNALGT